LEYEPGRDDGYFSEETVAAVKSFQAEMDIEVTGEIDRDTADLLQTELINIIQDREFDNQFKKAVELLVN
ncbi:peptidoglycan-binding protein, partial [Pseudomonas sp. 2995-3]|uniref:peptidoglycan-binding domain-containing protein n=1 Tax=Pseudomonas sp. 2995-3 TaxID=1712680 RepID=UPI000C39F772